MSESSGRERGLPSESSNREPGLPSESSGRERAAFMLTASAVVVTDAPSRYAKQLLAHLGHKVKVEPLAGLPEPAGQLVFSYGIGTVVPLDGRLVLGAVAADADSLAHVQDVLQRHLVKFGARRELVVTWGDPLEADDGDGSGGPQSEGTSGS